MLDSACKFVSVYGQELGEIVNTTMTSGFKLKSLQEFCFTHITTNLEQYSTDVLSLLPKKFRERLLRSAVPVLDICRLEDDTTFTAGIDMESLWEKFYSAYVRVNAYKTPDLTWRELFFKRLFDAVIKRDRRKGYFQALSGTENDALRISHKSTSDCPVNNENMDIVNYLVATKCNILFESQSLFTESVEEDRFLTFQNCLKNGQLSYYKEPCIMVDGPTPTYHKSCCMNQLVPPRYTHLFPEGSCYLPDSIALRLITEKCHYRPKQLVFNLVDFSLFIKECCIVDCLKGCFEEVESLAIQGPASNRECEKLAGEVLSLILQTPVPALSNLKVSLRSPNDESVLDSVESVLRTYHGLKKFAFECSCNDLLEFSKINSVTKNQPLLNTLSISLRVYDGSKMLSSETLFISWIEECFKHPSVQEFEFCINPATAQLVVQIITVFLSTRCSQEQTLVFRMALGPKSSNTCPTPVKSPPHSKGSKMSLRLRRSTQSSVPSTYPFNDAITFKYKCLSFDSSTIFDSFTDAFFSLAPLKLKRISFQRINSCNGCKLLSRLAVNPRIEMESLELVLSDLPYQKMKFFESILQRPALQSVKFSCLARNARSFNNTSFEHFEKKLIYDSAKEKTYLLSRK